MTAADCLTGKHNEALNVICAEEAGYQMTSERAEEFMWRDKEAWATDPDGCDVLKDELPNYTADQNAARSLLALLSDQWEWMDFHVALGKILGCSHAGPFDQYKARMLATALQISVAFAVARGRVRA